MEVADALAALRLGPGATWSEVRASYRTLLRESLKLSVEDRLRQLMELQRFAEELRRAGRAARRERRSAERRKNLEAIAELKVLREERGSG